MAVITKNNRIDIRLNDSDKQLIEKAASFNRQSISSYIVSVVIKQAQLDIVENETLILCNEDRDFVLNLLDNPGAPNDDLKSLFK